MNWMAYVGFTAMVFGLSGLALTALAFAGLTFKRVCYWLGCCLLVPAIMLMFEWRNFGPVLNIIRILRRKTWGKQIEEAEVNTHLW